MHGAHKLWQGKLPIGMSRTTRAQPSSCRTRPPALTPAGKRQRVHILVLVRPCGKQQAGQRLPNMSLHTVLA